MRHRVLVAVLAVLVVTAGCLGGPSSTPEPATDTDRKTATINFYVSDEKNAIDEFKQVDVTVTKVTLIKDTSNGTQKQTIDVEDRTIDITRLTGANATLVDSFNVSNGTYTKVFLHVGEVNATLESGEQVRVKLPSQKLHVNKEFTVGDGDEVDFVFDITVFKAGNSGKYILKPVISESGVDKEVNPVEDDERDDREEDEEQSDENASTSDSAPNGKAKGK